jgi:hypothetical protein
MYWLQSKPFLQQPNSGCSPLSILVVDTTHLNLNDDMFNLTCNNSNVEVLDMEGDGGGEVLDLMHEDCDKCSFENVEVIDLTGQKEA